MLEVTNSNSLLNRLTPAMYSRIHTDSFTASLYIYSISYNTGSLMMSSHS